MAMAFFRCIVSENVFIISLLFSSGSVFTILITERILPRLVASTCEEAKLDSTEAKVTRTAPIFVICAPAISCASWSSKLLNSFVSDIFVHRPHFLYNC